MESVDGVDSVESQSPAVGPARGGRSARDMARSIVVLLLPVLLLVGLFRLLGHERPPVVDTGPAYEAARATHAFDVLTPGDLPSGWHVQSAQFQSGVLRVGLVGSSGAGAQLVETAAPAETAVPAEVGESARPDGTVTVDGTAWQRYSGGRPGERALVLATAGRTIILVGTASDDVLAAVARSLR